MRLCRLLRLGCAQKPSLQKPPGAGPDARGPLLTSATRVLHALTSAFRPGTTALYFWGHFIQPWLLLLFVNDTSQSPHIWTSPWVPSGFPNTHLVRNRAHILIPKLNSPSVFPCSVSVNGPFFPPTPSTTTCQPRCIFRGWVVRGVHRVLSNFILSEWQH